MAAKPIAIIYLTQEILGQPERSNTLNEVAKNFSLQMPDYYWLALPDYNAERIEVKVIFEKDFTPVQYQEVLQLVDDKFGGLKADLEANRKKVEDWMKTVGDTTLA